MKRRVFSIIFLMLLSFGFLTIFSSDIKAAPPEGFDFNYVLNLIWTDQDAISQNGEFHLVTDEIDGMPYSIPILANYSLTAVMGNIGAFNDVGAIYPGHSEAYAYYIFMVDIEELHFYSYKMQLKETVPFDELVSVTTDDPLILDNTVSVQYMVDNEVYDLQIVNKGSQLVLPEEPEKEGYVFECWTTDPLHYYNYDPLTVVTHGFQLYAKFILEDLNINFYNGQSRLYVESVKYGNKLVHLPIEPLLTSNVIDIYDGSFTNMIFNNNTKILTLSDGKELKVSEGAITVNNDFLLWNYLSKAEVMFLEPFSSIYKLKVYIKPNNTNNYHSYMDVYISKDKLDWTLLTSFYSEYTNDFNEKTFTNNTYKDGPYYLKLVNATEGTKSQLSINKLTITSRIDYEIPKQFEFENWYLDEELTIPYIKDEYVFTSDSNLYAKWVEKEYELSFNSNNGSPITSLFFKEDEEIVMPGYNPSRIGYTFAGWYLDPELEEEFNLESMPGDDVVLYAKWEETEELQYLIEFYLGEELYTYVTLLEEQQLILPSAPPTAENQIFLGWYYDEEFTEQFKVTDPIEDDVTLYGKFGSGGSGGTETPPEETPGIEFKLEKKYVIIAAIVFIGIGLALIIRKRK